MPKLHRKPPRELMVRAGLAVRRLGRQMSLTRELIAEIGGLHRTDLEAIDFIRVQGGSCLAGELSKATGLTSGATTALIDRLEEAGYVARGPDPNDRRKQVVRIQGQVAEQCEAAYSPIQAEMFKLWSSYSAEELALVEEFMTRSTQVHAECLDRLKASRSGERR